MAKWAFWPVARVAATATARWHGPDGRLLQRPWRTVRPEVHGIVRRLRSLRPQPLWPRAVGVSCLAIAVFAALHPVRPMARHVAASASAPPAPRLQLFPPTVGEDPEAMLQFAWRAPGLAPPFEVVVLGPDHEERLRSGALASATWSATRVQPQLATGDTCHWCVVGAGDEPFQSTLQAFVWP
jgi:hypothetical protein